MKILFLSLYFEPDLCAGSFRNTCLFKELCKQKTDDDFIHVITAKPHRYSLFTPECPEKEEGDGYQIERVSLGKHNNGFKGQIISFAQFYREAKRLTKGHKYDVVYASSSRLFTAYLGKVIAKRNNAKLYLDIRDIFVDTIKDVFSKKHLVRAGLIPILKLIERYTFAQAHHINLVSEGFKGYFAKYTNPQYTYFTNGIDECFLYPKPEQQYNDFKTIVYAGNIGEGQGLDKVIPRLATELGEKYRIQIIGSGGALKLLVDAIAIQNIGNVEIIDPVSRDVLLKYYEDADFLFFHLNDYDAFKKVLPSKLFEYSTYNVPIVAGVSGYAAEFMKQMPMSFVAGCCDYKSMAEYIKNYTPQNVSRNSRNEFIEKYTRINIMARMAGTILKIKQ